MTFHSKQIIDLKALAAKSLTIGVALHLTLFAGAATAGEADVVDAEMRLNASGSYTISATILHDDTGWDHYADAFEIVAPDGTVLGTRVLLHPHVNEQPFTRSVSGVEIPEGITQVTVRAHDKVHGLGGKTVELTVER